MIKTLKAKRELYEGKCALPQVPYKWARNQFKSGDVFAQSHGGWGSFNDIKVLGVRLFTLSTYSHVGVIEFDESDGHFYAVEAVRPAAHRVLLSSIGPFYHLAIPKVKWTVATSAFVKRIIGALYSQLNAIKAFFKPLPEGDVSECAALTREVLRHAGVHLGAMSRPDAVVQRALELGATITYIKNGACQ